MVDNEAKVVSEARQLSFRRYPIAAVDRVVSILNAFDGKGQLTLRELSQHANLVETTALRYLENLVWHGLVERDELNRYRLGLRIFYLGQCAFGRPDPRKVAAPLLESLVKQFRETVNLAARSGDDLILVEALESTRSIKKGATIGDRDSWHSSALGKAILASLPEDEVREILERRGLPRYTPMTCTTLEALAPHLERIRVIGYAIDDEEGEEGLRCVAAPVFDQRGRPSYAISLSGPTDRFSLEVIDEMGHAIARAAGSLSEQLGYIPGSDGSARPTRSHDSQGGGG